MHAVALPHRALRHRPRTGSGEDSLVGAICHVIELDKMRLFIYSPIWMDQIWTFNLVYIHGIR
jgi:hypothetical protein